MTIVIVQVRARISGYSCSAEVLYEAPSSELLRWERAAWTRAFFGFKGLGLWTRALLVKGN